MEEAQRDAMAALKMEGRETKKHVLEETRQ